VLSVVVVVSAAVVVDDDVVDATITAKQWTKIFMQPVQQ